MEDMDEGEKEDGEKDEDEKEDCEKGVEYAMILS